MKNESVPQPPPLTLTCDYPWEPYQTLPLTVPSPSTLLSETPDSLIVENHEENSRTFRHHSDQIYAVLFFLLIPPQKVLSVEDGKIPTKKSESGPIQKQDVKF